MKDMDCPWVAVHLAAKVTGLLGNMKYPADQYLDNTLINTNFVDSAYRFGAEKIIVMGSSCMYPNITPQPIKEEYLWDGSAGHWHRCYGHTKRMMTTQLEAYERQFGLKYVVCIPPNLYGPNDDYETEDNHVVASLVKKFARNETEIQIWGDGSPTRDFLYVEDAAQHIANIITSNISNEIVNIGSGIETSIKELVAIMQELTSYEGKIFYDTSKPNGQPRKYFDIDKLKNFSQHKSICLRDGLIKTLEWYKGKK